MENFENLACYTFGMILSFVPTRHQYFISFGRWWTLEFTKIIVPHHQQVTCSMIYRMSWQDTYINMDTIMIIGWCDAHYLVPHNIYTQEWRHLWGCVLLNHVTGPWRKIHHYFKTCFLQWAMSTIWQVLTLGSILMVWESLQAPFKLKT